jgi:hypothetical protein
MTEIIIKLSLEKVFEFKNDNVPANLKALKLELSYPTDVGLNEFY